MFCTPPVAAASYCGLRAPEGSSSLTHRSLSAARDKKQAKRKEDLHDIITCKVNT